MLNSTTTFLGRKRDTNTASRRYGAPLAFALLAGNKDRRRVSTCSICTKTKPTCDGYKRRGVVMQFAAARSRSGAVHRMNAPRLHFNSQDESHPDPSEVRLAGVCRYRALKKKKRSLTSLNLWLQLPFLGGRQRTLHHHSLAPVRAARSWVAFRNRGCDEPAGWRVCSGAPPPPPHHHPTSSSSLVK